MFWLQLVVIVALLAAVGWLAIGGGGHMSEPMPDRPDLALPNEGMLARTDVDRVRFSVGARGYRMDEVDDMLDRLAKEIELREQRIAELEGRAPRAEASAEGEDEGDTVEAVSDSEAVFESEAASASESETEADSETAVEPESKTESEPVESKTEANHKTAAPVQQGSENEDSGE